MPPRRPFTPAAVSLCLILLLMLAAYAGLASSGDILADEFRRAALERDSGWRVFAIMAGWSPRLVSEMLLFIYARCILWLRQPLVEPAVLLIWALSFAAPLSAALLLARRRGDAIPVSIALALILGTLLLSQPGEMFYWPAGAAAYVPSFCAIAALVQWRALGGVVATRRARVWHAVLLLTAAGCSELGAMMALCFGCIYAIEMLQTGTRVAVREQLWWIIPSLVASAILILVANNRLGTSLILVPNTPYPGSWQQTLVAATGVFAAEMPGLGGDGVTLDATWSAYLVGSTIKLLLFASFVCICPRQDQRSPAILTAAALLATAFISIAMALHSFGELCCGRHASVRQGLILVASLAVAPLLALRAPRPRLGLVLLLVAMVVGFAHRAPSLIHDYLQQSLVVDARAATWRSGQQTGPTMIFSNPPRNRIANSGILPTGHCMVHGDDPVNCERVLRFFQKTEMTVEAGPGDRR